MCEGKKKTSEKKTYNQRFSRRVKGKKIGLPLNWCLLPFVVPQKKEKPLSFFFYFVTCKSFVIVKARMNLISVFQNVPLKTGKRFFFSKDSRFKTFFFRKSTRRYRSLQRRQSDRLNFFRYFIFFFCWGKKKEIHGTSRIHIYFREEVRL